jgi:hypothetical protein
VLRRPAPLAAALFMLVLAAGGCSNAADKASEKAIEKSIQKAASGSAGDVNVDVNGDEIKVETSDGTVVAGGGKLPAGFPESDVPLVDGEILVGVKAADGYSVSVKVDGDTQSAFDAAVSKLEGAGFAQEAAIGSLSAGLTGNGYSVLVSVNDASGSTTVTYIVGPA